MSRSRKPRKKYNPNKTKFNTNPLIRYSKEESDILKLRFHQHLRSLQSGEGDGGDLGAILFRVRVGQELLKHFKEIEYDITIRIALLAIRTIIDRHHLTSSWSVTDEEFKVISEALALVDDIQDNTTRLEQMPIFIQVDKEIPNDFFNPEKYQNLKALKIGD